MGSSSSCPEDNSEELSSHVAELSSQLDEEINKNKVNTQVITRLEHRILNDDLEKQGKPRVFAGEFTGLPAKANNIPRGGSRRSRRKGRKSHKNKKTRSK